jgi:hypothetical protein
MRIVGGMQCRDHLDALVGELKPSGAELMEGAEMVPWTNAPSTIRNFTSLHSSQFASRANMI